MYYDDLWCMKYLSGFHWSDLGEKIRKCQSRSFYLMCLGSCWLSNERALNSQRLLPSVEITFLVLHV